MTINQIVLISPPDERLLEYSKKEPLSLSPPLGLAYLAAYLRSKGKTVHLVDGNAEEMTVDGVCEWIKENHPEIVGICVFTSLVKTACTLATRIKEVSRGTILVAGGPHISSMAKDFLLNCRDFDFAVRREGEGTLDELVNCLSSGGDPREVQGITFIDKVTGQIVATPDRAFIDDLDSLPMPAYDLLPMQKYSAPQVLGGVRPFSEIVTSRGCPFHCHYCSSHLGWSRMQRRRSPANIVQEISELHHKYGVNAIRFEDDLFTLKKDWAHAVCDAIIEKGLNRIKWEANTRIGTFDLDILRKMKKAGCVSVAFGIEFGNQQIMDFAKKGIKVSDVAPAVATIKKAGLRCKGYFMMGYPNETRETIEDTIRLANTCGVNYAVFSVVTPYVGTELFQYCEENNLLRHKEWDKYQFGITRERPIRMLYITDDELDELYRRANREFYMSPRRIVDYLIHHPSLMFRMAAQKSRIMLKGLIS